MIKFRNALPGFAGFYVFATLACANVQGVAAPEAVQKGHQEKRIEEIYNQLQLTDDQKRKLEVNKQQHRAIMQNVRQQMKANREALEAQLMKPQLDMPKIKELHNRIKALQSQIDDNRLGSILAVREILSTEQFSKFLSLVHKHKNERPE
jgi:Spy/CpxP family protein refolding chaperone